jgi:hypothetical protein
VKYIIFLSACGILFSCKEPPNEAENKPAEAKKLYEINLASLKK